MNKREWYYRGYFLGFWLGVSVEALIIEVWRLIAS